MTIMERLNEHYKEALEYFPEDKIVGIFLQGSQNYGLDLPTSDVDTKLIVLPTFKDIVHNKKPMSTTHIRANEEHIDFKDIRLYIETFRKQNLNFLEILFTDYYIINPLYKAEWDRLIAAREEIAHMNPWRAVKSMKGVALEKYHAMEHEYPSKVEVLAKFGYDGKQVSHLLRIEDFLYQYINGEKYEKCLMPSFTIKQKLLDYKMHLIPLQEARVEALKAKQNIEYMAEQFCQKNIEIENRIIRELLEEVCYNIMEINIQQELKK